MSNGRNIAVGTVEGTGSAISISVGFAAAHVLILNEDGLARLEWYMGMSDGHGLKSVTTGTMSKITTNGVTPYADTTGEGIVLGADADINVNGETLHYTIVGQE